MVIHPDGFVERLQPTGPLVGVMETWDDDFADRTMAVQADSVLCVVSDGITEARDAPGRRFGISGVRRAAQRTGDGGLDGLIGAVFDSARAFADKKISDDMAVLAVRLTGDM